MSSAFSIPPAAPAHSPDLEARAAAIHATCRPLDAHADVPIAFDIPTVDFAVRAQPESPMHQVDVPRWREGGAAGMFFAVWTAQGPRTDAGHAYAAALAERTFRRVHAFTEKHAAHFGLARTPADFAALRAAGRGAVFIGMENAWPLGRDLAAVARFHALGMRYLGLCHLENNEVCDASTAERGPEHGGLSAFGRAVVAECNRLGVVVDVSHASDDTARQAAELSRAPIIASHSNARAVCDHPRNLPDDLVRLIAARGGVVHATFCVPYVKRLPADCAFLRAQAEYAARWANVELPDADDLVADWIDWESTYRVAPPPLPTVADFVDHLDHLVRVAGVEHVGIGTDFDGGGILRDCADIAAFPAITRELVRRGRAEADLRKLWSENTLRVLGAAQVAAG